MLPPRIESPALCQMGQRELSPHPSRLHAAADGVSLLLLFSYLSLLLVALVLETRAAVPIGWARPPMLPLHCLAGMGVRSTQLEHM